MNNIIAEIPIRSEAVPLTAKTGNRYLAIEASAHSPHSVADVAHPPTSSSEFSVLHFFI
jgi:hypothetical protein